MLAGRYAQSSRPTRPASRDSIARAAIADAAPRIRCRARESRPSHAPSSAAWSLLSQVTCMCSCGSPSREVCCKNVATGGCWASSNRPDSTPSTRRACEPRRTNASSRCIQPIAVRTAAENSSSIASARACHAAASCPAPARRAAAASARAVAWARLTVLSALNTLSQYMTGAEASARASAHSWRSSSLVRPVRPAFFSANRRCTPAGSRGGAPRWSPVRGSVNSPYRDTNVSRSTTSPPWMPSSARPSPTQWPSGSPPCSAADR